MVEALGIVSIIDLLRRSIMRELWKEIDGYPGYSISNYGNVWSTAGHPGRPALMLKGSILKDGYRIFFIKNEDGKCRWQLAHRLVAKAFLKPPRDHQIEVCHNDGNPLNNFYKNLRWDTHKNNMADRRRHSTIQEGERSTTRKLTAKDVRDIRSRCSSGSWGIQTELAHEYGMHPSTISSIARGGLWKSIL